MSRLHRRLMHVLVADVVGGVVRPGQMLPREADLAAEFGVSRGVAREAIRGMEERGLVTVKHGRGATANPEDTWDLFSPEVLSALLDSDRGTEVLADYLECRRILEIEAAGLAAERADATRVADLSDALARMTASAKRTNANPAAEALYHEADIDFHRRVIAACGNKALGRMTAPIHRALAEARRPLARPEFRLARSLPEHERIFAAISGHRPAEARAAMRDHLLTVEEYLREYAAAVAGGSTAHGLVPR
jgi:DNA-binding FadR family transcriptional regulator